MVHNGAKFHALRGVYRTALLCKTASDPCKTRSFLKGEDHYVPDDQKPIQLR